MSTIDSVYSLPYVRSPAGQGVIIPMLFTTAANGDATAANGLLGYSASRSTATYTITLPTWGTTLGLQITHTGTATITSWTLDPDAGTIEIVFSAAVTSGSIAVNLFVDQGKT